MSRNFAGLKVLLVEDDERTMRMMQAMLKGIGIHGLECVSNGREALQKLQVFSADLIITDYTMDMMDGIELSKQIRNSKSINNFVPIILVTGNASPALVRQAIDAGVHEFLVKPVLLEVIAAKIDNVIAKPRPFVQTASYVGPTRRRRKAPVPHKRRADDMSELARRAGVKPIGHGTRNWK